MTKAVMYQMVVVRRTMPAHGFGSGIAMKERANERGIGSPNRLAPPPPRRLTDPRNPNGFLLRAPRLVHTGAEHRTTDQRSLFIRIL